MKVPRGFKRSSHWAGVRKTHLSMQPSCQVCGGLKKLEVHHIHPFHTHPELELEPVNLITLCENGRDGVNCHLLFGHLGDYKSVNESVCEDAFEWARKIKERP